MCLNCAMQSGVPLETSGTSLSFFSSPANFRLEKARVEARVSWEVVVW